MIIKVLDAGAFYGKRSIGPRELMRRLKGINPSKIDKAIWSLYEEGFVLIFEEKNTPRISLNPKKAEEIRKRL